tara:strand:- start:349 stop:552 length:204 start_codon:yes stop_codon:yes gene_type:complete
MAGGQEMTSQEDSAVCSFTVDDVLDAREEFSAEQAELFLEQNRKYIIDAMCAAGFEAIDSLWLEEKE